MSIHKIERRSNGGSLSVRYRVFIRITPSQQLTKSFKRKVDAEAWEIEQNICGELVNRAFTQKAK